MARKHQWLDKGTPPEPQPKGELHERKVMLSVWWNSEGVVHFEFLPSGTTVTAVVYCDQLERVNQALRHVRSRRESVRFLHDNARPHTAKITRQKLMDLGWEVLPHPPYSPDLAPSDYHLFRSLQNFLRGKVYSAADDIERDIKNFFDSKPTEFYARGIHRLVERWNKVIQSEGDYIRD